MSNFLSPRLCSRVREYAQSHQNPVNRALHYAGIPILMVSALGLLSKVRPRRSGPDAAWPVLLGSGGWYLRLDRRAGSAATALLVAAYAAGRALPSRTLLRLFGLGAVMHSVGHYGFEHKPPAFLSNPAALLEAPAWLLAVGARKLRPGK